MSDKPLKLIGGPVTWEGAVSVEETATGVRPWRIPWQERELFHPDLVGRAGQPAGIRITFLSNSRRVTIGVEPTHSGADWTWDLVVEGERVQRLTQSSKLTELRFSLAGRDAVETATGAVTGPLRRYEIFMPSQYLPATVRGVYIDPDAQVARWDDPQRNMPRFVMYGSSITHAKEAAGPSETWTAIVALRLGMHLTNLGFGGQEHLEPSMARVIADLPSDLIGLCVSGNVWGLASLSTRTYRPAVIGMVEIIRSRKPAMPIVVLSSIRLPEDEGKANVLGLTVDDYRKMTAEAVETLRKMGDRNLYFVHGPDLYGAQFDSFCEDGVHPNAQGQRVLADRFIEVVMPVVSG